MKNSRIKRFLLLLIVAILFAGTAFAETTSDMNMKRWSYADVEPDEVYKYYLNFGAADITTGSLIESDQFSMHIWSDGLSTALGTGVNMYGSYSTRNGRGVFSKLPWQIGQNEYHIQVTRVPENYRIPAGTGTFDIKQDFGKIPTWVKVLKRLGEGAFSVVVPGGGALVKAGEFLLKTGMPTDITCSGNLSATMNTTEVDWKTPWYCYKWIEVKLEKKYAQSVSFVIPEYDPEKAETVPHVYDASGKEYDLTENGTYAIRTTRSNGETREYPKFTSGNLPVGEYKLVYKGETYAFTITGVNMPRLQDGTCDISSYNSTLTEQDRQIARKYGFDKYYTSANQFVPLDDNDWTKALSDQTNLSVAGDGTEAKNHVLVVGQRYGDEYVMEPPTEYVTINVQYASQPYAASEGIRFYTYTQPTEGNSYYKYLAYTLEMPLEDGQGSRTFDATDDTGVFELLRNSGTGGLEPVRTDDRTWKVSYSPTVDNMKNIVTHIYTLTVDPIAAKKSVTIYPVDENNNNISKYYVATSDTKTDEPVTFVLAEEGGLDQWIRPDQADRVQYTLQLGGNRTYTLKMCYSVTGFYRTDSCWTIVTDADGSIKSFTPAEKTSTTGPAEKKGDSLYSVMLLYKDPVELTFRKEWVDALGSTVRTDEEPADAVYITVKSRKTRTENHLILRRDRDWQESLLFCADDSPEIIVEKVLNGSEEVISATGWDDLYSPKLGIGYQGGDARYVSTLPFIEDKASCTIYLRNVKETVSFYKTNGISFVQGYSFKLDIKGTLYAISERDTTIDGAPATEYTIHLNDLTGFEAGKTYTLREYQSGVEIGYWNFTQGYDGVVTFDGLYYGNSYQTLKADGSSFRTGVTVGNETMNLMDNGTRRGYDTYTVSLEKDWSGDIADLPEEVVVELIPIGTGTTLSEKLGKLADIGTSAGSQTVTLSATNGWHADVTLRNGVVYWAYEKSVKFKDETQTAKFTTSYYIDSRTAGQPRTESWTATYAVEGEEDTSVTFGSGENAVFGALICNENESGGVRDTLHISNASDAFHTFRVDVQVNIPDGVSAVQPRSFVIVLEEYDAEAGTWSATETRSLTGTGELTVYFDGLSAEKNYRARLRYDDEEYGIIESDAVIGVSTRGGTICPKEQVSVYKAATPYYSLAYDDSQNDTDNIQTILLTPAGNIKVYTTVMYGGTSVSALPYEMVHYDAAGDRTTDSHGTLTHINSDTPDYATIPDYDPASYSYDLELTGSFCDDEKLYICPVEGGPVYRVEKKGSVAQGVIYIYLYEQRQITLAKAWVTDSAELDRPDSVTLVLQKKVKSTSGRITSCSWEDAGEYTLSEANNWVVRFYTDKYVKNGTTTAQDEYRVRELSTDGNKVDEEGLVLYQIPERNDSETVIPAHATLFLVRYTLSEDNNTMMVTNTAVMKETVKKVWQLPDNVSKTDSVAVGLYARAEGSEADPALARNVYTHTVSIDKTAYPFAIVGNADDWQVTFLANKYNAGGELLVYSAGEVGISALPEELTEEKVLTSLGLTEAEQEKYLEAIQSFRCVSGTAYNACSDTDKVVPIVNLPKEVPATGEILVYKIWDDEADHSADSVKITLYNSEKAPVETAVLNAAGEWKYNFTGLSGSVSDYSVLEEVPEGYYAEYGSFANGSVRTVINHPKGEASVVVNKNWDESIIIRPGSVEITVIQHKWNEEETEKAETGVKYALELNEGNSWTESIGSLPLHDDNGCLYDYTIQETKVDGEEKLVGCFECAYTTHKDNIGENVLYTFICTNLDSDTTGDQLTIRVEKTWDDGSEVYQEPITLRLKAGEKVVRTFTLSKDDATGGSSWSKTITLEKYDYRGDEIAYTLEEETPAGYSSNISQTKEGDTLVFTLENKSTGMHVILRYIGDGDAAVRPDSVTVRLQKKDSSGEWVDVRNGESYVEKVLPEPTAEQDEAQQNQFAAAFTDLTPGTSYRVRVCVNNGGSLTVLPEGEDRVGVKDKALVSSAEADAGTGYEVVYSEVKNNESYPVQVITLNKLLRVDVQWLDNGNAAGTRPDELPLTFLVSDSKGENQTETGYTDVVKGWKDDAGTGTFVMSEDHGYRAGSFGTARVTGEEKDDDRILWRAPNGTWYTVKYEETSDPYVVRIVLTEQVRYSAKKKWDIDILGNDKPGEIEVRLETWEGEKGDDENGDEPDGTEVETITLKNDGTEEDSAWEGSFRPVDRYRITYEEDGTTIRSQTEINYRVREVYNEKVLTVETGRKLVVKPGKDATFHVDTYYHPDGSEEKEHDTVYTVKYETTGTTTTITNTAVLDTTITKFWVMLGHAEKPDSVYLVLLSKYKDCYKDIVENIPAIGGFISSYTPMATISGDNVTVLGKELPVSIGKADGDNNWTVSFRVKKYGTFGIPMDFKGAELVSGIEQSLASWLLKLDLPVGFNPLKKFISFSSPLFMITDSHGISLVANVWGSVDPDPDPEHKVICGIKYWNDDDDPARPSSVTIQIKDAATGKVAKALNVTAADGWVWSWDQADPSVDYIVEEEVPDGYTVTYDVSTIGDTDRWIIINARSSEGCSEHFVKKYWRDSLDHSADTVHVRLYRNDTEIASADLTKDNGWSYTFRDLDDGYTYSVKEDAVPGYNTTYSRITGRTYIYNTPVDTTPVKLVIKKVWENATEDEIPATLTMDVLRDGAVVNTVVLEKDKDWTAVVTTDKDGAPLRRKSDTGGVYNYTISEPEVPEGCTFTVSKKTTDSGTVISLTGTNSYSAVVMVKITIRKVWNETPVLQHDPVQVFVKANGEIIDTVILGTGNAWRTAGLYEQYDENGDPISYTIEELPVDGYTDSYDIDEMTGTLTVTNTPWEKAGSTLIVTDHVDTESGGSPDRAFHFSFDLKSATGEELSKAQIILQKKDGTELGTAETGEDGFSFRLKDGEKLLILNVAEGTLYTVKELPTDDEDKAYDSIVVVSSENVPMDLSEADPDSTPTAPATIVAAGTKSARTDFVDFYQTPQTEDIQVTKDWEDGSKDAVFFVLYKNGEVFDSAPTPVRDGQKYTFPNLISYTDTGSELVRNVWSVTEKAISGYWVVYNNVGEYAGETKQLYDGGTVHNRPYTEFRFTKIWSGTAPRAITVEATNQFGTTYTRVVDADQAEGSYTIKLPMYVDGEVAVYTVREVNEGDVIVTYRNEGEYASVTDRIYSGGTIVNSCVPQTGDASDPFLYAGGALAALGSLIALTVRKRNAKHN